jgi:predicted PurR-regulated permease PerM
MKQALLILIPVIILGVLTNALSPILLPFIMAIAIAYLTNPIAEKLVKWKINRTVAAIIPSVFFIITFMLITVFVLPSLIEDALAFSHKVPAYLKQLETTVLPTIEQKIQPFVQVERQELLDFLYSYGDHAAMVILTIFRKIASSTAAFFDVITLLFITPVVMFYLIRDWPHAVKSFEKILPKKYKKGTLKTLDEMDKALSTFLRGQFNVSLVIGIFYGCGLWLTGLEMGFVIGLLTGLFSFIPYIGMLIGCITAFAVAIIQFQLGDTTPYIYIAIVFILGQVIESMILQPKLIGDKTGLHPVWVIFALMAGGQLGGFLGILIALPLATIMVVLVPKALAAWQKSVA